MFHWRARPQQNSDPTRKNITARDQGRNHIRHSNLPFHHAPPAESLLRAVPGTVTRSSPVPPHRRGAYPVPLRRLIRTVRRPPEPPGVLFVRPRSCRLESQRPAPDRMAGPERRRDWPRYSGRWSVHR